MNRFLLLTAISVCVLSAGPAGGGPLHDAAERGDLRTIGDILSANPDLVDATDDAGRTALMRAAVGDFRVSETIELLVDRFDADPLRRTERGETALHFAASKGSVEAVRALASQPGIDHIDERGRTAAIHAAIRGAPEHLGALINAGADLTASDNAGRNALMHALSGKHAAVIERLLEHVDPGGRDIAGRSPLHHAADASFAIGIELLLEAGADVGARDERGRTPLHLAAEAGAPGIMHRLVSAVPDRDSSSIVDARDFDGRTPLMYAAHSASADSVQALIDAGATIALTDHSGRTPLHHAALGGTAEAIDVLVGAGADANARDRRGETPVTLVAPRQPVSLLESLLNTAAHVDLDAANSDGVTALMISAERGTVDAVVLLLERGARADTRDDSGRTPLIYAARGGSEGVRYDPERWYQRFVHWRLTPGLDRALTLVVFGVEIDAVDHMGMDALMHSATRGDEAMARFLLGLGADVHRRNVHGETALILASRRPGSSGQAVVSSLIAMGAEVGVSDRRGWSSIHHAARFGSPETLRMLLDAGAAVNQQTNLGRTPLMLAAEAGAAERVRTLISRGADPDLHDNDGHRAIDFARRYANRFNVTDVIDLLADTDDRVNGG